MEIKYFIKKYLENNVIKIFIIDNYFLNLILEQF